MFSFFKRWRKNKAPEHAAEPSSEPTPPQQTKPASAEPDSAAPQVNTAATEIADAAVKIYSLSTCSHCKATKKFLSDCTVKYEFVDVDLLKGDERKAILEDVKKFNPKCSFPTIVIGERVIIGYVEEEIKEALGL